MFDPNVDFFEDNAYYNYEQKFEKLKSHVVSKDVTYDLEISPIVSNSTEYCALQLRPTKLSNTSLDFGHRKLINKPKKQKPPRKHDKRHSKSSRRSNQDDDSILNGLQTVIDLCGLLEKYENKPKHKKKPHKKNPINNKLNYQCKIETGKDYDVGYEPQTENETHFRHESRLQKHQNRSRNAQLAMALASNKSKSNSSRDSSYGCTSFNQSCDYRTKIDEKSNWHTEPLHPFLPKAPYQTYAAEKKAKNEEKLKEMPCPVGVSKKNEPCDTHCSETEPVPPPPITHSKLALRRRSQEDDINQYWAKRNSQINILESKGSKSSKKSKSSKGSKDSKKSKSSKGSAGSSGSQKRRACCAKPRKAPSLNIVRPMSCTDKDCCIDGDTSVPCVRVRTSSGKEVCVKSKCRKALSAKCFPPVEIAPCDLSCDSCHAVGDADPKLFEKFDSDCECKHPYIPKMPDTACTRKKLPVEFKKSRLGFPHLQPVVGYCNNCRCGGNGIEHIKYSMVKITEFAHYATYEIMQASNELPKNMPSCIAEIFVVSRLEGIYDLNRPCSQPDIVHIPSTKISFREPPEISKIRPNTSTTLSKAALKACSHHSVPVIVPSREPSCKDFPPSLTRFGPEYEKTDKKDKKKKKNK